MGYYTAFELAVYPPDKGDEVEDMLGFVSDGYGQTLKQTFDYVFDYQGNGLWSPNETAKWYEHDENMKELSRTLPEVVFQLDGEGEDSGDIWRDFYKDGKAFHWELTVIDKPQFDDIKDQLK